jgi:hypothetical protein
MADNATADMINEASASDTPQMPRPLPTEVPLLRGIYVDETQEWHTTAQVRELTGADEEALAELGSRESVSYTQYMTGVLERAVTHVGTLPVTTGLLGKLILPDRDMLFLAIVKATYGLEREIVAQCAKCSHKQNIILELENDFPILGLGNDMTAPLEVELKLGAASFRYPNGEITAYAIKHSKNTPELDTLVIAQCVITTDETPLQERTEWARALGIADRKKVEKTLADAVQGVGPQLGEVDTRCAECDSELPLLMDWVSLLLG